VQVFNYLFGSLTRIFTTIQEVDDPVILYGFVAGFLLNAVLAFQMVSSGSVRNKDQELSWYLPGIRTLTLRRSTTGIHQGLLLMQWR
jgi:mannose-P-dolichol utilization defect 1